MAPVSAQNGCLVRAQHDGESKQILVKDQRAIEVAHAKINPADFDAIIKLAAHSTSIMATGRFEIKAAAEEILWKRVAGPVWP